MRPSEELDLISRILPFMLTPSTEEQDSSSQPQEESAMLHALSPSQDSRNQFSSLKSLVLLTSQETCTLASLREELSLMKKYQLMEHLSL